jgi:hypothetical protein
MLLACAGCICIESAAMKEQSTPQTTSLLSELYGHSRSLAELDGSKPVKRIALSTEF